VFLQIGPLLVAAAPQFRGVRIVMLVPVGEQEG
jgi:hypothetical protein